jgi:hypothetical protein
VSERLHWRDAEEAVVWLRGRPSDYRTLLLLARLPLADAKVLEWLSGVRGGTIIYRSLTRLQDAGLIAHVTPPAERGSSPQRFYLTDLGLATFAIDQDLEVGEMARKYHLRDSDLVGLLLWLPQLAALYDMLGAVAASHPGRPNLLGWERPWSWHYRRPTAKAPIWVTLPAFAALRWEDEARTYFLLPDLGTFPPGIYRTALVRLLQLRRIERMPLPPVVIATDADRGIAAWRELLEEVRREWVDVPLKAQIVEWEELHTSVKRLEEREGARHIPAESLTRSIFVQPLRPRRSTSPLPRIVADVLRDPAGTARAGPAVGLVALTLSPADYRLLSVVACHPFLSPDKVAILLTWPLDTVRRRRNRLVDHGLIRLVGPDEIGKHAGLQLLELTREGLELVAAYRGLSLPVAAREIGFASGGPHDPIGARTKLLGNLAHTLGTDELFVSLYRTARQLAEAGGDDAMLEWQNATACTRRYLRPDGYGIYRRNGRRFGFFLEFDRGTMNRRDYFKKFSAYYDYATTRRFERDYNGYPTVLIVTTSNGAEERIVQAARAAAAGRTVSLPLLIACRWRIDDPNNPDGLLGRIWREPHTDFDCRCWWPPRSPALVSSPG